MPPLGIFGQPPARRQEPPPSRDATLTFGSAEEVATIRRQLFIKYLIATHRMGGDDAVREERP